MVLHWSRYNKVHGWWGPAADRARVEPTPGDPHSRATCGCAAWTYPSPAWPPILLFVWANKNMIFRRSTRMKLKLCQPQDTYKRTMHTKFELHKCRWSKVARSWSRLICMEKMSNRFWQWNRGISGGIFDRITNPNNNKPVYSILPEWPYTKGNNYRSVTKNMTSRYWLKFSMDLVRTGPRLKN